MKIDDIRAFVITVKQQSVGQAARVLGIPQYAVARRILSLEETLQTKLIDRNTRPPRLSKLGKRVFDQCQQIIHDTEMLTRLVDGGSAPTGDFRIGVAPLAAEFAFVDATAALMSDYPDLKVSLAIEPHFTLIDKVSKGEIDAAAVVLPETYKLPQYVVGTQVAVLETAVVSAKRSRPPKPCKLDSIHQQGWVLGPKGCIFRDALSAAMERRGLPLILRLSVAGINHHLGLVAAGIGLGIAPRRLLGTAIGNRLSEIPVSDFRFTPGIWIIHSEFPGDLQEPVDLFIKAFASELEDSGSVLT